MKNIILLIFVIIFFSACPLLLPDDDINEGCNKSFYYFDMPVYFSPLDSTINIGDTITVTSYIPKEKWDMDSNYIFDLDSIDFHMGGGIIKLDTLIVEGGQYHFVNDFEWIADNIYNFQIGSNAYAFDYQYSSTGYEVKFSMIPKKKGIYLFDINSLITASISVVGEVIYTKNKECKTNKWYPNFKTNNGNNFKELLLRSPTKYYTGYYFDNWNKYNNNYGAHCFKVE